MNRKIRGYIGIVGAFSVATISSIVLWKTVIDDSSLGEFGLLGVFLAAVFSHTTIVLKDLFMPLFLSLTRVYNPILIGIVTGWGGAIGDAAAYFLGWGVSEAVDGRDREDRLSLWIKKYGLWAILLFSITPIPDTPIVILAGSNRISFKKILIIQGIGKMILYSMGAVVGGLLYTELIASVGRIYASVLIVALSLLLCILLSWKKSREKILAELEKLIP
ncbi:VTT domain-containing protein [Candidatus Bathyarchaeota archaeon]|nr:VTT domain-containing protein [Candidatus Bathyarchaeota archaeon]MBS7631850.1 VTT domain-containing protein [Candidatus Bathyarchaeota archaeon]